MLYTTFFLIAILGAMFLARLYGPGLLTPKWWKISMWSACGILGLYLLCSLLRTTTLPKTLEGWLKCAGLTGTKEVFRTKRNEFTYYFDHPTQKDGSSDLTHLQFVWGRTSGEEILTAFPISRVHPKVSDVHFGPPTVRFAFALQTLEEPCKLVPPLRDNPSWWLQEKRAEKVGFMYVEIFISMADFNQEPALIFVQEKKKQTK